MVLTASNKIVHVEFVPYTPTFFEKARRWNPWNVTKVCANTYTLITGKKRILEIFGKMNVNPFVQMFPTAIVPFAIIKDPQITKEFFSFNRNDKNKFTTEKSSFKLFIDAIYPKTGVKNNILSCDLEESHKLHLFLISELSSKNIQKQEENIKKEAQQKLAEWENLGEIDLSEEVAHFTGSVIGKLFLGFDRDYNEIAKAVDTVFESLGGIQARINAIKQRVFFWQDHTDFKVEAAKKLLKETVEEIMQKHQDSFFYQNMLKAKLSDDEIKQQIITLILAAQDTTGNLLKYVIFKLAQNPQLQEDFINDETEVYRFIREAIRLFSPASLVGRFTYQSFKLMVEFDNGSKQSWFLPKDTLVTAAPSLMARDAKVLANEPTIENVDNLDQFNPYRWKKEKSKLPLSSLIFSPFGKGDQHKCPGSTLAFTEIVIFLSELLRHYKVTTALKKEPYQITTFVNRLEGSIPIQIERRKA